MGCNESGYLKVSIPDVKWVKTKSIEDIREERVYEAEDAYNFIANDIVAHNTYLKDRGGIAFANSRLNERFLKNKVEV